METLITYDIVDNYTNKSKELLKLRFDHKFPKAMIKMGKIQVKTNRDGEIRKVCSKFN